MKSKAIEIIKEHGLNYPYTIRVSHKGICRNCRSNINIIRDYVLRESNLEDGEKIVTGFCPSYPVCETSWTNIISVIISRDPENPEAKVGQVIWV